MGRVVNRCKIKSSLMAAVVKSKPGPKVKATPVGASQGRMAPVILAVVLALACVILSLQVTDLTLSDLGRHLKNGELILHGSAQERQAVLHTNFYSFAQ